ncbi:MAG: SRPBCC domain-containing protein [Candidatus Acidiferrales bacterium]
MVPTEQMSIESLTLTVNQVIKVNAPIQVTFDALLEQLQDNESPNGPLPMKLEPWPGGRWYRDLGNNNGHFWATVQAIKRPTLLEFFGPLMMSHAVISNVQYRLAEENGVTVITFHHKGFGHVPDDARGNVDKGWSFIHDKVRQRAEREVKK